jgi:hypothetical protein
MNIVVRFVQSRLTEDVLSVYLTLGNTVRVVPRSNRIEHAVVPKAVVEFLDRFDHGGYAQMEHHRNLVAAAWQQEPMST